MRERPAPPAADELGTQHGLTAREREGLCLLADGRSNPEIARALVVSPRTVTTHVERLFAKLGVSCRAEAASLATRRGLCKRPPSQPPCAPYVGDLRRRIRRSNT